MFGNIIAVDYKNQMESTTAVYIKNIEVVVSDK